MGAQPSPANLNTRAVGLLAAGALLLAGCGTNQAPQAKPDLGVRGATSLSQRFRGVEEHRAAIGSPSAPYSMVEFVDLQCPYCARFDRDVLPAVIDRFVRPARLRLELRPIAALGPDSAPAGATTIAAEMQNRAWQFADLFYRNQAPENSGYVTRAFVDRIAGAVPGLDRNRLLRDFASPQVRAILIDNQRSAQTARIDVTPGFRLGRTSGVLAPFYGRGLTREDFVRRLEAAIGRG